MHSGIPRSTRRGTEAFSLTELLIAAILGGMILATAAWVLTSDVRSNSSQEAIQRLRDHWGRVNYFIDTEVREGYAVSTAAGTGNCSGATNPYLTISISSSSGNSAINYYNKNGDLWHCGPDILDDGSLDFSHIIDGILVENATLQVAITDASNARYTLILNSRNNQGGLQYTGISESRTTGRSCDATSGICF